MSIDSLAHRYNEFQNKFGQSSNSSSEECSSTINNIFDDHFKKIANGVVLVAKKAELFNQLSSVKEFAGNWSILEIENIPSADNKKCTMRYILQSEKAGLFEVIAIMSSADGCKIDCIDEIYYQQG